jgi:predicted transcriptional regulator
MNRRPFNHRLRAERERLGLTPTEAGAAIGRTYANYVQLETDTTDPRLSTLAALVRAGFRLEAIAPEFGTSRKGK